MGRECQVNSATLLVASNPIQEEDSMEDSHARTSGTSQAKTMNETIRESEAPFALADLLEEPA